QPCFFAYFASSLRPLARSPSTTIELRRRFHFSLMDAIAASAFPVLSPKHPSFPSERLRCPEAGQRSKARGTERRRASFYILPLVQIGPAAHLGSHNFYADPFPRK